ncbi:MAG: phosphonate C-P lyase system protein PhnG [Desulfocapsa sp.]|nr:phosphonate C-P lyase system protein PhnG [Desulfocapsa sp.]
MNREELNFFLQQVDSDALFALVQKVQCCSEVQVIQQSTEQTLMLPVTDPVTQGTFYGGEVLVNSAIVRVNTVEGWAMVLDQHPTRALHIAILDGAYAAEVEKEAIVDLAGKGQKLHGQMNKDVDRQVASTRVSFDLM